MIRSIGADRVADDPTTSPHDPRRSDQAVVRLDGTGVAAHLVGGKAAALDRLVGWSVPVPPTAVVTTAAYRRVTDTPAVHHLLERLALADASDPVEADEIDRVFVDAGLPDDVLQPVVDMAAAVGGGRTIAIRSSATAEDLTGSSFAGQYRSVLAVDPSSADDVERAVLLVFASLHHAAARA